jgi:hypothetical protein
MNHDPVHDVSGMFGLMEAAAAQQEDCPPAMQVPHTFGGPRRGGFESAGPADTSIRRTLRSVPPPSPFATHLQRLAGLPRAYRFAAVALLDLLPAEIAASAAVTQAREALQVSPAQEKVMRDYLTLTEQGAPSSFEAPGVVAALSDAADALRAAQIPAGTPLFRPGAVARADVSGREQTARVMVPVPQPLDRVAWIVNPRFWPHCIGQVEAIDFPEGIPHQRTFRTWIRETINLATPVRVGSMRLVSDLDVTLDYQLHESARLSYRLRPGGSAVLDADEGKIEVFVPSGARGDVTMVLIEKRVVLKPHLSLEVLFDLNPDGLAEMLRYWVLQSYKHCQIEGTDAF